MLGAPQPLLDCLRGKLTISLITIILGVWGVFLVTCSSTLNQYLPTELSRVKLKCNLKQGVEFIFIGGLKGGQAAEGSTDKRRAEMVM